MKKQPFGTFFGLFFILLLLLSIPRGPSIGIRGMTVAFLAPSWEMLHSLTALLGNITLGSTHQSDGVLKEKMQRLLIENQQLSSEISRLKEIFQQEMNLIAGLASNQESPQEIETLITRQRNEIHSLLTMQLEAVPAKVIFRSPSSWNSSCWINVGRADNEKLAKPVICKNSPVVVNNSAVGVIDYVGWRQSRVQLITDAGLSPSVRALRGGKQNQHVLETIFNTVETIKNYPNVFENSTFSENLILSLEEAKQRIIQEDLSLYLAKGELQGSNSPYWRNSGQVLKGIGFNYDFDDEYGPAQDLRSAQTPILKIHDILVTTGMDGVFPPGLSVAKVTYIAPLKEGDYYYELEAKPLANLEELSTVFVLPSLGYEK